MGARQRPVVPNLIKLRILGICELFQHQQQSRIRGSYLLILQLFTEASLAPATRVAGGGGGRYY